MEWTPPKPNWGGKLGRRTVGTVEKFACSLSAGREAAVEITNLAREE